MRIASRKILPSSRKKPIFWPLVKIFRDAIRHGMAVNLPGEEDQWSYLRLSLNGAWEVLTTPPEMQAASTTADLTIPLALPLVPIILVAHVGHNGRVTIEKRARHLHTPRKLSIASE